MSCSAKKNKKNLDSTHLAPTFREQWGQSPVLSPYLCILILSHIFHDFFVLWSGWVICHTKDPYIFKDDWTWWLLACVNGLCTGNMPMQDVPLLLPHPPLNFRQVRWKLAMQFLCSCNAYSPLQNTCCHVLKRRTRKTKFAFQVLLLITAFDIHPVRPLYRAR
jgi:hypothetical protein